MHLSDWINNYGNNQDYSFIGAAYSGIIDVFFLSGRSSYNPVLWTMKIELFGSFVIYILCLNRMIFKIPFLVGVVFILTATLTIYEIISTNLCLGLSSFYGGYLFSIYGKKVPFIIAAILAMCGLYLAGAHNTSLSYSFIYKILGEYTYNLCNFISGFFIVYSIIFNDKFESIFSKKTPVFMGKVSFSVYLIHLPILSTLGVFLFNFLYQSTSMYNFSAISSSILTIAFIYCCSLLFYKYIDLNGMKMSNSFANYFIGKLTAFNRSININSK